MEPASTSPGVDVPGPAHVVGAARRGARVRSTLVLGVVGTIVALVVAHFGGCSPLLVAPLVVGVALVTARAARVSLDSVYAEVDDLEAARNSAMADAMLKAQFLANMSHEIRTPMNGILGMAELLVQTKLDADQEQMATTIQSSAASGPPGTMTSCAHWLFGRRRPPSHTSLISVRWRSATRIASSFTGQASASM